MSRKLKVDMTGVETYSRAPEGTFKARLKSIEETTTQGGDDALKAIFEILSGEGKGCSVVETFVLTEKGLWKLKMYLDVVGVKSSGRIVLDLDKLVGKVCVIEVEHRDVNGTTRANITNYLKASALSDDSDEDEEDEEDEDEEEEEVEEKPTKKKPAAKKKPQPEPDEDENEDEDDEDDGEEEEEEKPVKKTKSSKPAAKSSKKLAAKKKPEPEDEDDDDDEDWEEDDE